MNYISILLNTHIKIYTDAFMLVGYIKLENVYTSNIIGDIVIVSALTKEFKKLTYTIINNGVEFKKEQVILSDVINDLTAININNIPHLITSNLEYYTVNTNKLVVVPDVTTPSLPQFNKIDSAIFDNKSILIGVDFNNNIIYSFECNVTEVVQIQSMPLTCNFAKLHIYNSELFLVTSNNASINILKYNAGVFSIQSILDVDNDSVCLNDDLIFIGDTFNSKISTFRKSESNNYELEYELKLQDALNVNGIVQDGANKNRLFLIFKDYVSIIEWTGTMFQIIRILDIPNVVNLKTLTL